MATQTATYSGRSILWNRMRGTGTEPKIIGWGDSTSGGGTITTCANPDVNLFHPLTEARVTGTSSIITTTQLGDTYQVTGQITAAGTDNVREAILVDSTTASPSTTVTGTLTSGATGSQVVGSTTGFPATLNFYCQLDNEVVLASVVDATHLNLVTRGVLGSTAASHNAAAVITLGGDGGAGTAGATSAQTATVGSGQGGNIFAHADFAVITLSVNDSISFTWKDQLT